MSVKLPKYEDIQSLSEQEQEQAWTQALDSACSNSHPQGIDDLVAQIHTYETQHGMTTEEMLRVLCTGKHREDEEFSRWQRVYWALSMLQGHAG